MSVLLDAGPALNFLAVGQQGVLIRAAELGGLQLSVPERVDREVLGMCKSALFAPTAAAATWRKLKAAGRVVVLDDTLRTTAFTEAVTRISGVAAEERLKSRKSLGEIMVLAHASTLAQAGSDVVVLIDEGDGRTRCRQEQAWLTRAGAAGQLVLWKPARCSSRRTPPGSSAATRGSRCTRRCGRSTPVCSHCDRSFAEPGFPVATHVHAGADSREY